LQRSAERIAQQVTNAVTGKREHIDPAPTLAIIEAAGRNLADMIATVKEFGQIGKRELNGPCGSRLVLDPAQVFSDDPGAGTPAMIYYRGGAATFWCAQGEGRVDADRAGFIRLPKQVRDWLDSQDVQEAVDRLLQ
jgi:hypothetical protein